MSKVTVLFLLGLTAISSVAGAQERECFWYHRDQTRTPAPQLTNVEPGDICVPTNPYHHYDVEALGRLVPLIKSERVRLVFRAELIAMAKLRQYTYRDKMVMEKLIQDLAPAAPSTAKSATDTTRNEPGSPLTR
jgi:hypothetical protein